jgi:TetR/AcrR family transcriptional repressor of mexJK operon
MTMKKTATRQPKPRPGRPKDVAKRSDILAAAGKSFLKHGFEGASMDAIAREAEVSKLTVYSHFRNKDVLFREVIADKCDAHRPSASFLTFADEEPRKALTAIGLAGMRLLTAPEVLAMRRLVIGESGKNPKIAALFYEAGPQRAQIDLAALLEVWAKKGWLELRDANRAADHFLSMLRGDLLYQATLNLRPPPAEAELKRHVDDCVEVFLRAYEKRR